MVSTFGSQWVTGDDIIQKTLKNLGITAAGQAVDPEDLAWVSEELHPMFLMLEGLEICYVPQFEAIPGAWSGDLAAILSGICAPKFGVTNDDHIRWVTGGLGGPPSNVPLGAGAAALSLKQQTRGRPSGEPARALYF